MKQVTTENKAKPNPESQDIDEDTNWIDISVPLFDGLVHWPGDPPVSVARVNDMEKGALNNIAKINTGSHTGTHIDAPRHFIRDGQTVSSMPLNQMIGAARVIEINNLRYISPEELMEHDIQQGERILFKTRNSSHDWSKQPFDENFISISKEAADFLAQKALRVIGIDYLSVGGFKDDGAYIHRTLLGSGAWLIEGLNLSGVKPGNYFLNCLPLKLEPGDGAPARAILRQI